jgi:lipopolysaccharide export LptBFGC system permease protein LptF
MFEWLFTGIQEKIEVWIWIMAAALVASAITSGILFGNTAFSLIGGVANLVFFVFWTTIGGVIAKRIDKL